LFVFLSKNKREEGKREGGRDGGREGPTMQCPVRMFVVCDEEEEEEEERNLVAR